MPVVLVALAVSVWSSNPVNGSGVLLGLVPPR
jgi:hypothetical protein